MRELSASLRRLDLILFLYVLPSAVGPPLVEEPLLAMKLPDLVGPLVVEGLLYVGAFLAAGLAVGLGVGFLVGAGFLAVGLGGSFGAGG